jgi:predicted alpha-1,2-mannosidase
MIIAHQLLPVRQNPPARRRNNHLLLIGISLAASWDFGGISQAKEPVDYIDPFIGTDHQGKTFPGATTPAGMVQLSPDTITGGDNGSGYHYYQKTIQGFSFTHMTGVGWYGDLGNFMVMPTTGPLKTWYGETDHPGTGYLSSFSHKNEVAQAGYYAVTLDDYGVRAEMTAAPHSGILRFTFPENPQSRIQVDLARRIGGTSLRQTVKVTDDHTIEGEIDCTPQGGGWGHGGGHPNYTVYYHAEFSQPFQKVGVWSATLPPGPYEDVLNHPDFIGACENAQIQPDRKESEGQHLGFYTEFPTAADQVVQVKVGISFVSIAGARSNLAGEIPKWDFDQVRQQARKLWATAVSRMEAEGGTEEQKSAFFTALYHALLEPQIFADLNGDYPGGDGQPHQTKNFTKRTIFSGWDVYRSQMPLLTIIAPDIVNDLINSFIELADQNNTHAFDRWEFLNAYSGCMNGWPFVIVLNDAYQKGIRNYDVVKAYAYAVNTVGNPKTGYVAETSFNVLSASLQDMLADWNLSQLAASLGKTDDSARYLALAQDYKKLFDPNAPWTYDKGGKDACPEWKGWFRAIDATGRFSPWQGLTSSATCQESSVYEEGWMVPYDLPGLIALNGGTNVFIAKLTDFFERTKEFGNGNPYDDAINEPSNLVPFLFNRAGAPWLTQKWVRKIDEVYKAGPDGECGDDDCGQISSWFVLAASGIHPACPGDTRYEIFSPLFDRVTMHLDPTHFKGGTFTITARNNSPENVYIQSATLNGQPLNRCWITYQEITAGGTLDLVLGPRPNKQWGIDAH